MSRISKFAAFMLTTLGVALAGASPAFAREYDDRPAPIQPAAHVTEQVTSTTASPLWQFVVVAIVAASITAIIAIAVARIARRDRPRRTELLSA